MVLAQYPHHERRSARSPRSTACKDRGAGCIAPTGSCRASTSVSAIPPGDFVLHSDRPWQGRDEARQIPQPNCDGRRIGLLRRRAPVRRRPVDRRRTRAGPNLASGALFPGTVDEAAATAVTLARRGRTGVDFSMRLQPVARIIEGRIVGPAATSDNGTSLSYGGATMTARWPGVHAESAAGRYAITCAGLACRLT